MSSSSERHQNGYDYDILQETRDIVEKMTESERFSKGKRHLMDALHYRQARNDPDTSNIKGKADHSKFFRFCYLVQTSDYWNNALFLLSMVYMYLIVAEPNNRMDLSVPMDLTAAGLDNGILALLILDAFFEIVHKNSWKASLSKKYPFRFWAKIVVVSLFIIDNIVFYTLFTTYPIRPFRILRAFIPYFYNAFARKALHSLISAGKDIVVYLVFYAIIIMAFSIVASQIINLPDGAAYDQYNSNYYNLGTMSFLMYVLASYDAWPDYEEKAVDASLWYYPFFVAFIILNAFYFVTIPTTVIFASFKSFRSKIVLIDDIKQRNSLLLCFVCLGEKNLSIRAEVFHRFMLYVYKNKVRLADHIKELSFRLDPNNNSIIYASDFMKLCTFMEEDSNMLPPAFRDWKGFLRFRGWLKEKLLVKRIVKSDVFEIVVIAIILFNFVIIMVSFFTIIPGYETIEIVLLSFYTFECVLRFFGEGPEKFANDERNQIDVVLLIVSFALLGGNDDTSVTVRKIARLIRLFRLNRIVRILWRNEFFRKKIYLNSYYCKLRLLFNQLYICVIVGLKTFPLFMTVFYVLSVIGMERFDNRFGVAQTSPYALYDKYSSFRNLWMSHLVCVQVMIEAGWSPIVYDYAYRYDNFAGVAFFFVSMHIAIVIIMVSLMKGMAADLYETIYNRYNDILRQDLELVEKEKQEELRRLEYEEIRESYNSKTEIRQDTIKKKEIREAKKDREMIDKLKAMLKKREQDQHSPMFRPKKPRTMGLVQDNEAKQILRKKKTVIPNNSLLVPQATIGDSDIRLDIEESHSQQVLGNVTEHNFQSEEAVLNDTLCDEDIDVLEDEFVDRVVLKEEDTPFSAFPLYPKFLKVFIQYKLRPITSLANSPCKPSETLLQERGNHQEPNVQSFLINKHRIGQNPQSTSFYTHILESLLHIQKPEDERKKEILHDILKTNAANQAEIEKYVKRKYKHNDKVEVNTIIRKVYLSNTNQALIDKFQIEYFSDIYGNSFKELSRVALQPMLKHEALLLDTLAKVMRYPDTNLADFFHILATLEYRISNSLVKKGSIFKFVFEVEELGENWFAIEVKENKSLRLHFLKSGIWIYEKDMRTDDIYYGNDIFAYDTEEFPGCDRATNDKIIRLLYNNFESLAFSMLSENNFFASDPNDHEYDLYSMVVNAEDGLRQHGGSVHSLRVDSESISHSHTHNSSSRNLMEFSGEKNLQFKLKISKIMLVVLSKENERPKDRRLPYRLTNLTSILDQTRKKKVSADFRFDDDENETYEKLKNLAAEDYEKIADSEGLPYAFIVDMMLSVRDILTNYKHNFIEKVERVLNQEFNREPESAPMI